MKPVFVEFQDVKDSFWLNVLRVESIQFAVKEVNNHQVPGSTIIMNSGEHHFVRDPVATVKSKIDSEITKVP